MSHADIPLAGAKELNEVYRSKKMHDQRMNNHANRVPKNQVRSNAILMELKKCDS